VVGGEDKNLQVRRVVFAFLLYVRIEVGSDVNLSRGMRRELTYQIPL
jgi:hypothetical protein